VSTECRDIILERDDSTGKEIGEVVWLTGFFAAPGSSYIGGLLGETLFHCVCAWYSCAAERIKR